MSTRESLFISQSTGPRLHVERYNAGSPAVVLVHGGGDGAFAWDLFAPVLAQRLTTLAIDLPGHGDSGWIESGRYRADNLASDVAHAIDQSNLDDLIFIGHSLGGEIAIHLCARYAPRVAASVLVDFAPDMNEEGIDRATELIRQSVRFYSTVDQYADWLKQTRLLSDPSLLEHIARRSLHPDGEGFRLKLDPAVASDFSNLVTTEDTQRLWNLLKHQSCPTLIVRGAGSAVVSRAVAQRMATTMPRAELATVNAAGHSVMLDNPAEFERVVLDFLKRALDAPKRTGVQASAG